MLRKFRSMFSTAYNKSYMSCTQFCDPVSLEEHLLKRHSLFVSLSIMQ